MLHVLVALTVLVPVVVVVRSSVRLRVRLEISLVVVDWCIWFLILLVLLIVFRLILSLILPPLLLAETILLVAVLVPFRMSALFFIELPVAILLVISHLHIAAPPAFILTR